jgi:spermidine/putrescine transport system permease protein
MSDPSNLIWRIVLGTIVVFMLLPLVALVVFSFAEGSLIKFPITGLTTDWYTTLFDRRQFWAALDNSLIVTGTVGGVSSVVGTMAALALARIRPRVAGVAMALFTLPVMVPPLVLGVGLLTYFTTVGITLGLNTVIMSHLIFTQPFVMLVVYARMARFDYTIVNSARDLGASPLRVFFTIVLPIARPTIIGATLIAMALSLDDFIITFFTIGGGNTLPTFLWGMMRRFVTPEINVVAVCIMALTITVSLVALRISRYRG